MGIQTAPIPYVVPSTSGNVLTSNGSVWQSSTPPAAGASFKQFVTISNFTAARVSATTGTSGTVTFDTQGDFKLTAAASSASKAAITYSINSGSSNTAIFSGNPTFGINLLLNSLDTANLNIYAGLGGVFLNTPMTFLNNHVGLKIVNNQLFGTVADGSTETATAALTTIAQNDSIDLYLVMTGSTNVAFYYNKNFTGWSAATNVTTHIPTGTTNNSQFMFAIDNNNVGTTGSNIYFTSGFYYR